MFNGREQEPQSNNQSIEDAHAAPEGESMSETVENNIDIEPTEAEVQAYVEKNLIKVPGKTYVVICVDGRYNKENHVEHAIAAPGADLGVPMALLDDRFGMSPQETFDTYNAFLLNKGDAFTWHTDDHEGHGDCKVGCGHCNAAINKSAQYGLEGSRVEELLNIVRAYQSRAEEQQLPADCTVLHDDHAERAILVINSDHYTVEHSDDEGTQYFGYDAQRYMKVLAEFVEYVATEYADSHFAEKVTLEALQEVIGNHTTATLGLLGSSKGKPIFEVTISEEGEVVVTKSGNAPILE